ncbi:ATP-binding protein [Streptomyces sp. NBC_00513]|uniref:ATP-binding protein n=1 Tax=unclassified Streptomyces TaxID=2593676 RepID=UPI00224F502C|nr:ATP-binding protein [Streptomyces sp. NBC_00424]MCX5071130.1 ATP-binding protein [Streptomyces sp. NBC_00424]WUD45449.1 ATP-binding protein [Streptomyces sp. NBC_00513]
MPRIVPTTSAALRSCGITACAHHYELAADIKAPRLLRTWITARLAGWHLHGLSDDLTLIATELATNAVRHGGTPARITLALRDPSTGPRRVVRLEVEDSGPGFSYRSHTRPVPVENCTGRGLLLVDTLSSAWGTGPTATGQLVWAELWA